MLNEKIIKKTRNDKENKAVYTTDPVAGGWAGAVMIWAEAVMIWAGACSKTNFPTLKMPKNAKKQSVTDRRTDRPTDRPTDGPTDRHGGL